MDRTIGEKLERYFHDHGKELWLPDEIPGTVMKAIERFTEEQLAAALNDDGWTYCEDRLPEEKYKYYLVTRKTGDVAISPFGTNGFDLAHVIAWRPLAAPAKGRDV